MRKNNIRRWLHCALDFLPLFLIPVFMIYSHRHDITERTEVDIEYKYESNEVNTVDDLVIGNVYSFNCEDKTIYNMMSEGEYIVFTLLDQLNTQDWISEVDELFGFSAVPSQTYVCIERSDFYHTNWISFYPQKPTSYASIDPYINMVYDKKFLNNVHIELIDFNLIYDDLLGYISYTDYNEVESVTVEDTKSDIMSVFTNDFYNATHTYFNMDSVINLGQVYNWFETNLFGGNVPIGIHAVWHIISYEFVMDIIFLVYSVFMFIIDFTEKFLSSMYDKSFGGGR